MIGGEFTSFKSHLETFRFVLAVAVEVQHDSGGVRRHRIRQRLSAQGFGQWTAQSIVGEELDKVHALAAYPVLETEVLEFEVDDLVRADVEEHFTVRVGAISSPVRLGRDDAMLQPI